MADTSDRRQNTLFTYGLGLVMGLPVANLIAEPLSRGASDGARMAIILGLTLVLGATGAVIGYMIDKARGRKGKN